ncbi:hypothetical protein [Paenibacillus cremeus]|uniref:Uncharacterized protein n=1 Tax=Paenibacillus cremeus TaxID=2163881 RepID=A0A559JZU6_9BACL|nr:hypothetical protein [Paenibacillus cremeus]TVY05422.1 hypothetical protein FPZ49_30340 [Paenibacillus cremeus]
MRKGRQSRTWSVESAKDKENIMIARNATMYRKDWLDELDLKSLKRGRTNTLSLRCLRERRWGTTLRADFGPAIVNY